MRQLRIRVVKMAGVEDVFGGLLNMRPKWFSGGGSGPSYASTGRSINAGWWSVPWLLLCLIQIPILTILLGFLAPYLSIFIFVIALIASAILATLETAFIWLFWSVLRSITFTLPDIGLRIGSEIGEFKLDLNHKWDFSRYLLPKKKCLDLGSSSPHILVVGGSQTGKSSTIKTLLQKKSDINTLRAYLPHAVMALGILFVSLTFIFNFPLPILPFMAIVYLVQSGHLTQHGVYAGLAGFALSVLGFFGAIAWLIRPKIKTETPRGTVIIDYHGEYGYVAKEGYHVVNALDYAPLSPIYPNEPFDYRVTDVVDSFLTAFTDCGDLQLVILKKALEQGMSRNASLGDALITIQQAMAKAKSYYERDRYAGLCLRLAKIAEYDRGQRNIHELAGKSRNVVFDFSHIRDRNAADFYADLILRRYLAVLMERKLPTTIVIDEAHRLNNPKLRERGITTTTVKIAREAGKFGGRLIISSQNLADFPEGFSANFGNIIAFRMPSSADMGILEKMTGISGGLLQGVMNSLPSGQGLLVGPHDHYSIVKVDKPKAGNSLSKAPDSYEEPSPVVIPVQPETEPQPHLTRDEEILEILKGTALTVSEIARRLKYQKSSVFRHLQKLARENKIIRYEDTETPDGLVVFYEINNPNRNESCFHKVLIAKVRDELESAKILGGPNNPDLAAGNIAIEVETGTKRSLDGFIEQVKKRFEQDYAKVIVVVINQSQKARYEQALSGLENVSVRKITELGDIGQN